MFVLFAHSFRFFSAPWSKREQWNYRIFPAGDVWQLHLFCGQVPYHGLLLRHYNRWRGRGRKVNHLIPAPVFPVILCTFVWWMYCSTFCTDLPWFNKQFSRKILFLWRRCKKKKSPGRPHVSYYFFFLSFSKFNFLTFFVSSLLEHFLYYLAEGGVINEKVKNYLSFIDEVIAASNIEILQGL